MLFATLLALAAAVFHATWNLLVKQSGDRWIALWAMTLVAGGLSLVSLVVLAASGHEVAGLAWGWAAASAGAQIGYLVMLARAYGHGDFSVSYPVARGGGALLAAIGGVALLDDHLSPASAAGIGIALGGLLLLAVGQSRLHLAPALAVAVYIAAYTLIDTHGSRVSNTPTYALAVFVCTAVSVSAWGLARGDGAAVAHALRSHPRDYLTTGVASSLAYGMVLAAVRYAPVGYVTALRESSVVLAALAGWRVLGEGNHRRRLTAAAVMTAGLTVMVAGR